MFVLKKDADHLNSMAILEKANLVPYEGKEILSILMRDVVLKEVLKGEWFYIAGKGIEKNGPFTIDGKGELAERKGKVSVEKTVYVCSGSYPLWLCIATDDEAEFCNWRFGLVAGRVPSVISTLVVGKAKSLARS